MWNAPAPARRRAAHPLGPDHAAAGAPRRLGAVGRALVAVELEHRQPDRAAVVGDLVERLVDEHADELDAPLERRGDLAAVSASTRRGPARPRSSCPSAQAPSSAASLRVLEAGQAADLDVAVGAGHAPVGAGRRWPAPWRGRLPSLTVDGLGASPLRSS